MCDGVKIHSVRNLPSVSQTDVHRTGVSGNITNFTLNSANVIVTPILGEELILSGTYQCTHSSKGDPNLVLVIYILNTACEVFALCLAVWIAVKKFRDNSAHLPLWIVSELIKSHVLYFGSFFASAIADSNSMGVVIYSGSSVIIAVVQMFVLGPRLILDVREFYAKLEHVHIWQLRVARESLHSPGVRSPGMVRLLQGQIHTRFIPTLLRPARSNSYDSSSPLIHFTGSRFNSFDNIPMRKELLHRRMTFVGTGIEWFGDLDRSHGIVAVFIDGKKFRRSVPAATS
ncbi:uncharacterized protein F5147DRAFT_649100 [Suillus discolor]|uniref:Uncharacterized protein n=1 Tax=Suillus discolor TaxID=1912936 RepID=A0A9P7FFA0_9AGAM|nr:uncharacterized protein F5147DRAFT_649100 [Suillus discolor]KAG2116641.1 hypothetical protein F5147DRAFT_649100 [Suillus discolor]